MIVDPDGPEAPFHDLERRLDRARSAGRRHRGTDASGNGRQGGAQALGLRIGFDLVGGVVLGVLAGLGVDRWLGTRPWGLVICFFIGASAGMYRVFREITGMNEASSRGVARPADSDDGHED